MRVLFTALLLFPMMACSSHVDYELPALPFSVSFPSSYGFTESETAYYFSSDGGPALFVFEKEAEDQAFFELFENGYETFSDKPEGVWVICASDDFSTCFVQNLSFAELYPLHVQVEEPLSVEDLQEIREQLMHIRVD